MAGFCKQCSIEVFGKDYGDMRGITKQSDVADSKYACVLCEYCGPCQVDCDGKCINHSDKEHETMYKN
jgi:hypothetical protein